MLINPQILKEVFAEHDRASLLYPPFNSPHEGYSIILEELEELWEEIKKSPKKRDPKAMRTEAIQLAAMAFRFLQDCTEEA